MSIDDLYAEHREMLVLADALIAIIDGPEPPGGPELAQIRWKFASLIERHLKAEMPLINLPLRRVPDPQLHAELDEYDHDLTLLRAAFIQHNVRWNPAAVAAGWREYRTAAHTQIAALRQRMAWEEDRIYPRAAALNNAAPDVTRSTG